MMTMMIMIIIIIIIIIMRPWAPANFGRDKKATRASSSEGGMIRLETLMEIKSFYSSFSSLSFY